MKKSLFLIVLTVLIYFNSFSQEGKKTFNEYKNDIHIGITPNPFYGFANINYERKIIQLNKNRISTEVGFGYWQTWGAGGSTYKLKINDTFGKKKHHIEFGIGSMALYDKENYEVGVSNANYFSEEPPTKLRYTDFHIAASAGYLYKKPQGHFIFKLGFAWPESVYLAFGYAF